MPADLIDTPDIIDITDAVIEDVPVTEDQTDLAALLVEFNGLLRGINRRLDNLEVLAEGIDGATQDIADTLDEWAGITDDDHKGGA